MLDPPLLAGATWLPQSDLLSSEALWLVQETQHVVLFE